MNLIKALEGLSGKSEGNNAEEQSIQKPTPHEVPPPSHAQTINLPNVWSSVLEKHEAISNRVRNGGTHTK